MEETLYPDTEICFITEKDVKDCMVLCPQISVCVYFKAVWHRDLPTFELAPSEQSGI
jgi:hypothetical protein